jgi:Protein of unknown function (DUF3309)
LPPVLLLQHGIGSARRVQWRLRARRGTKSKKPRLILGWSEEARMRLILLIVVILLLIGALPTWPYSAGWGYYPSGGLGVVVVILLVLLLLG